MSASLSLIARRLRPRYAEVVHGIHAHDEAASGRSAVLREGIPGDDDGTHSDADLVLVLPDAPTVELIEPLAGLSVASRRPVLRFEAFRHVGSPTDAWIVTLGPVEAGLDADAAGARVSRAIAEGLMTENRRLRADRHAATLEWTSMRDLHLQSLDALEQARSLRDTASFRLGHLVVSIARTPRRIVSILRAARSTSPSSTAPFAGSGRPDRSPASRHLAHELLWRWRTIPDQPFVAVIGRTTSADTDDSILHVSPHDATGLLANSSPAALVVDICAGDVGLPWTGLGDAARPHLRDELEHALSLARRCEIPVAAWISRRPSTDDEWFESVVDDADIVLAESDAHVDLPADAGGDVLVTAVTGLLSTGEER